LVFFPSLHSVYTLVSYLVFLTLAALNENFFVTWIAIEVSIFLFIDIGFSVGKRNLRGLLEYLILQAISSIPLVPLYLLGFGRFFILILLLKIAAFPFTGWFYRIGARVRKDTFFLLSTFQKIVPIFILLSVWTWCVYSTFGHILVFVRILLTAVTAGSYRVGVNSVFQFFVLRSIRNNSWILLGVVRSSRGVVLLYLLVYRGRLLYLLRNLAELGKSTWVLNAVRILGLPPFPLFFLKFLLLFGVYNWFYISAILFRNLILICCQVSILRNILTYKTEI